MSLSWRRLRTLLVREMRATLRDPFTLGILIAAPLVALLAFGYTLSTEIKYLHLAVLDADDSPASRRLIADLAANETFTPYVVRSREDLQHMLVSGKASAGAAATSVPFSAVTRAPAATSAVSAAARPADGTSSVMR